MAPGFLMIAGFSGPVRLEGSANSKAGNFWKTSSEQNAPLPLVEMPDRAPLVGDDSGRDFPSCSCHDGGKTEEAAGGT